jgi:hypothetical protein
LSRAPAASLAAGLSVALTLTLTLALALAARPGCGADDAGGGPDGGALVDGGGDGDPGCLVPDLAGTDAYLADVVGHLAAAPRASVAARAATREYLTAALEALGLVTSLDSYAGGANVVGRLAATDPAATTWILIGAHFDTVAGSPGADDNATGVATALATVRNLAAQPCRAHGVLVAAFDQEELGLVGSTQLAARLRADGTALVAVHTIDQAGWDADRDRRFEIELPTAALWTEYQAAAAATGVAVTRTTTGDTDHVPFRERGYPAAGVSEEFAGGDTSPHYHTAGDTLATVELAYTARAVRLVTTVVGRELGAAP